MRHRTTAALLVACAALLGAGFAVRALVPVEGLTIDEADYLFSTFRYLNGEPLKLHIINGGLSLRAFAFAPIARLVPEPYKINRTICGIEAALGQAAILCAAFLLFGAYGLCVAGLTLCASRIGLTAHIFWHVTWLLLPMGVFFLIFAHLSESPRPAGRRVAWCFAILGAAIFWAVFTYAGGRSLILAAPLLAAYLVVTRKTGVGTALGSLLLCALTACALGFAYAGLCADGGATFAGRLRAVGDVYFRHTGWGKYVPVSRYPHNAVALYRQFFDPAQNDYASPANVMSPVRASALPPHLAFLAAAALCAMLVDLGRLLCIRPAPAEARRRFLRDLFLLFIFLTGVSPAIMSDQPTLRRSLMGISALVLLGARPIVTGDRFPRMRKACACATAGLVLWSSLRAGASLRSEYLAYVPYHRAGPTRRMHETVKSLTGREGIDIVFIPDSNPYRFSCFYGDPAFAAALDRRIVGWGDIVRHVAGREGRTVVGIICENNDLAEFEERYGIPGTNGFARHIGREIDSGRGVAAWNDFTVACWGDRCDLVESLLPRPRSDARLPNVPNI
ncbi:MAG: hypothetical protein IT574_11830 [Candidatus Aureabacteria bacterium]|nr:hypothetical protein [Candidatus Auribacterota bacterium]